MRRVLNRRHLYTALIVGVTAFTLGSIVAEPAARVFFTPEFIREWSRVSLVMRLVHTRFVDADKVPLDHLARNAAAGAAAQLDRYSEYLDAEDFAVQEASAEQRFTGIGVLMRPVDGLITIDRVFRGGGAEAAGLRPGDRLLAVGDESLVGLALDTAIPKVKGPENTEVTLTVRRPGESAPRVLKVARRTITVSTVGEARLLPDRATGYVSLDTFERGSPAEVRAAIESLQKQGARRLVIDLRGNPGGLVDAAVALVGLFCPQNSRVVSLEGRGAAESQTYATSRAPAFPSLPLIVLIDGRSASASEIFAGALRDHRRAILVGEKTFGKGLVQTIFKLDEKTGLKLTTARYRLPNGAMIHGVGVPPHVAVAVPAAQTLRFHAQEAHLAHAGDAADFRARYGFAPEPDPVLDAALALFAAR